MEISRITIEDLKSRLDRGEQIFIIDTRSRAAWSESDVKIPGAVRIHFDDLEKRINEIPSGRTIVTYCT
jgi:rhodanese-related sulfurtransferase